MFPLWWGGGDENKIGRRETQLTNTIGTPGSGITYCSNWLTNSSNVVDSIIKIKILHKSLLRATRLALNTHKI